MGACKRQPPERIAASLFAGLTELGQNYEQEAIPTSPQLAAFLEEAGNGGPRPSPRLHRIGQLQRNKPRLAVDTFEVVDSVDSFRRMQALPRKGE